MQRATWQKEENRKRMNAISDQLNCQSPALCMAQLSYLCAFDWQESSWLLMPEIWYEINDDLMTAYFK